MVEPVMRDVLGVNTRLKLAAMWSSFMFLYIYVDYFHLYMPGSIQEIHRGKVFVFDIDPLYLLASLISVSIPAMMIFLSIGLSARLGRWINIIVSLVYIPYSLFNLLGVAWVHMFVAAALEVSILLLVIRCAWAWSET